MLSGRWAPWIGALLDQCVQAAQPAMSEFGPFCVVPGIHFAAGWCL
jgi:hypothetical protein